MLDIVWLQGLMGVIAEEELHEAVLANRKTRLNYSLGMN